jgi:hypothetical protein
VKRIARTLAAVAAGAAGAYGAYAAAAWYRYGRLERPRDASASDELLDVFIPAYELRERHHIRIGAPAELVLSATRELDLGRLASPSDWTVLAEAPGREIVLGTAARPRRAELAFRTVAAESFAAFDEPGFVKIALALRVEPLGPATALLHTEIRVAASEAKARKSFRRYWAAFAAGAAVLRLVLVRRAKAEAERRWRRRDDVEA